MQTTSIDVMILKKEMAAKTRVKNKNIKSKDETSARSRKKKLNYFLKFVFKLNINPFAHRIRAILVFNKAKFQFMKLLFLNFQDHSQPNIYIRYYAI